MAEAKRDQNFVPSALGVSSVDNVTTLPFKVDPVTGRLLVDLSGGGGGTVQTISIASANGFAGSSDGDPVDPTLTISTTINAPVLAGNGTAISAATTTGSGTTVVLNTAPTLASTVTIGTPAGTTGAILLRGTTSGTVTLSVADAAGTWTMKLPTTDGNSGQFLQTDGSGNTTWASTAGGVSFGSSTQIPYTNATTDNFDYAAGFTFDGTNFASPGDVSVGDDLLLTSSGAVINFNAGDVTITHSANTLTLAGGVLVLPSAGLEVGAGNVVTLGGAFTTSGANALTLTTTGATNVTLPTSGTLMANPMTTGGDLIYGGASGAPTRLANGSATNVLTSAGGTSAPTWSAIPVQSTITVANEATDTSCFVAFFTAASGDLQPKTNANLTFNSNTGVFTSASAVLTTADINGGTIDGTTIGASSPSTGVFTTLVAGSTTSLLLGTAGSAVGNIGFRNATSGTITLAPVTGALGTVTLSLPAATDQLVARATTDTLTNKRIQPRSSSAASGDISPDLASANVYRRTALSAGITINAPTGTPVLGEVLVFMLIDNGTSRALTWNAAFIPMGQALPTATTISKELLVTAQYNGAEWETVWAEEE